MWPIYICINTYVRELISRPNRIINGCHKYTSASIPTFYVRELISRPNRTHGCDQYTSASIPTFYVRELISRPNRTNGCDQYTSASIPTFYVRELISRPNRTNGCDQYTSASIHTFYVRELISKTNGTRQQSVGNMPPPSPRHLFPHVLHIMPRNPKYDKFQPKGHHNEENPQSMIKMPGNPKFYLFH